MTCSTLELSVGIKEESPTGGLTQTTLSCVMTSDDCRTSSGKRTPEDRSRTDLSISDSLVLAADSVTLNTRTGELKVTIHVVNRDLTITKRAVLPRYFSRTLGALTSSWMLLGSCTVCVSIPS